jgi:hypothetical protein
MRNVLTHAHCVCVFVCAPLPMASGGKTTYTSFPIYVCVPEWEVEGLIQACPKERRADLVFMQTACIEGLLKRCEFVGGGVGLVMDASGKGERQTEAGGLRQRSRPLLFTRPLIQPLHTPTPTDGLCSKHQTQCVPYFGVSGIGRATEGRVQYDVSKSDGEPKYAGQTAVCGKWRGAVAERLGRQDLSCLVLDYTYW